MYRNDFRGTLQNAARPFLFSPLTPPAVLERVMSEYLEYDGATAAALFAPFYDFDARAAAERLKVPVRAIHSDLHPSDVEANRRHFHDFSQRVLKGRGHYPMLEVPEAFNAALGETLEELRL